MGLMMTRAWWACGGPVMHPVSHRWAASQSEVTNQAPHARQCRATKKHPRCNTVDYWRIALTGGSCWRTSQRARRWLQDGLGTWGRFRLSAFLSARFNTSGSLKSGIFDLAALHGFLGHRSQLHGGPYPLRQTIDSFHHRRECQLSARSCCLLCPPI